MFTVEPFVKLLRAVVTSYPGIFLNPVVDVLYLVVLGLVAAQYARVQSIEERFYGRAKNKAFTQTLWGIGLGLLGGLIASVLLVMVGVTVSDAGVSYLLPISLFLFLFSPRFLCFSYSGALVSLSYLLFGWPKVNVQAIMALVACLHAGESFLIRLSGSGCATPIYMPGKNGRTVGGFLLQRFWPVPLIVLFMVRVPDISQLTGLIHLPDWWPLIKAPLTPGPGTPVFQMMPIVAALGYGDMATSVTPRQKAVETSRNLFLFSVILLGFSVAASRWTPFVWVAALFAPIGHEVVIRMGNRQESERDPRFVSDGEIVVLDVFEGTPAHAAGIRSDSRIIAVGGEEVRSREDLEAALAVPGDLVFTVIGPGEDRPREILVRRKDTEPVGILPAPGIGDSPLAVPNNSGPLLMFLSRLAKRLTGGRAS
ncbi:MAG TPA: PDZ domain-containing protein [Firmicutes bacterium]|nr:PDZ domain-containing protein [Candidatus Fermentithermobacillaceae bacterium]